MARLKLQGDWGQGQADVFRLVVKAHLRKRKCSDKKANARKGKRISQVKEINQRQCLS